MCVGRRGQDRIHQDDTRQDQRWCQHVLKAAFILSQELAPPPSHRRHTDGARSRDIWHSGFEMLWQVKWKSPGLEINWTRSYWAGKWKINHVKSRFIQFYSIRPKTPAGCPVKLEVVFIMHKSLGSETLLMCPGAWYFPTWSWYRYVK